MRAIVAGTVLAIVLGNWSDCVWAATNDWVSSISASWFTSANWSLGAPSASDDAFVSNTNKPTAIIEGSTAATTGNLFIENGGVKVGNISAGSLTVNGEITVGTLGTSGTLTLSIGTISVNTISVGANGSYSDTSSGTIILTGSNPTIQMAGGVSVVVNSQISGSGGLMKGGLGALTLAGDNTYSGGTTVNAGTLQVGNGGTSGSLGSGDVSNNAVLVFNRSDSAVVSNVINGTGSLTHAGAGTLTLVGNNTYSGRTIINAGTLQVGDGGTTGSLGSGAVSNSAALVFNRSDGIIVSNPVSGTGNLTQAGSGTLTLVGNNTYSGRTIIGAGTLQVGDGGTNGWLGTGAISNNAALVFDRSDSVVVSNVISGTGSLTQAGSGTLILDGSNTYTGRTVISAGTLQVGDGGTSGTLGLGAVSNNSALVFNRSDSILVTNRISGTGSLTQAGTGTLTLTNVNSYSGGTWVSDGGTLTVRNSNALGTGGLNIIDGTLKVNQLVINVGGNYTQAADGTVEITIGGTNTTSGSTNSFGQLNITGTASLDGTVHVVQANSFLPQRNDTFVLLVASNGVTGTFSAFTNDIATSSLLLDPKLTYNVNDVTLTWAQLSFVPYALTRNQRAVAQNLDAVSSSTVSSAVALVNFLDYLADPTNNLPLAYDLIAPEELTAMFTASFAGMDAQGSRFLKRVNELRAGYRGLYTDAIDRYYADGREAGSARPSDEVLSRALEKTWSVCVEGGGKFVDVQSDTNAPGYSLSSGDFTIGMDRRIGDQLVVGAAVSYDSAEASLSDNGSINMDSYLGQLYAAWFKQGLHIEGMLGGGVNSYDTRRQGLLGIASSSTDGLEWNGLLGGGYDWQHGAWSFGPQVVVQYMSAEIDGFTEEGSMAPLHIESQSADALRTRLGAGLRYRGHVPPTLTFVTPEISIAWQHDYLDNSLAVKSRFASGAGNVFTVHGPELGSDSIIMSLGLTVQWKPTVGTYLHYTMQSGPSGYEANAVDAGMRISF